MELFKVDTNFQQDPGFYLNIVPGLDYDSEVWPSWRTVCFGKPVKRDWSI